MKPTRMQWIDMAKGLGILLMILGHMFVGQPVRDFIYSFHMAMFVIISGYLFKESTKLRALIPRRIRTLVLPYALTNVAAYFVRLYMLNRAGLFTISGAKGILRAQFLTLIGGSSFYVKHFTFIETCGPIWFVTFLFCIELFYALISRIKLKNKPVQDALYLIFLLLLSWLGKLYAYRNGFLFWNLDVVPMGMVFFHIGVMIKRYQVLEWIQKKFIWIFPMLIWLVFYRKTGSIVFATREYIGFPYSVIISVCGSLTIMLAMKGLEKISFSKYPNRALAWAGRNSMIILAFHTIEFVHVNWIEHIQERIGNVWISYLIYATIILLCTFIYTNCKIYIKKVFILLQDWKQKGIKSDE